MFIHKIDYFGFVYLWYDTKRKRYIIGSHHGSADDNYTTSTGGKHVLNIFKNRPHTMRRKILEFNTTIDNYKHTQQLEQKWLDMRPNINENIKYYNRKNFATGGFDVSITREKSPEWVSQHIKRQQVRVLNGTHNFTSEYATIQASNRVATHTHHFLHSDFNKKPFQLYKNNQLLGTYESKVHSCKDGIPNHIIDKLRKHGTFITTRNSYKSQLYKTGDTFTYVNIT